MGSITFTNSKGLSVEMGNQEPFILTKIEGAGAVATDVQTQKSPLQDGVTYIDNTLGPRSLSIEIMVLAENEKEMAEKRRRLLQVFNPKLGPGKLTYEFGDSKKKIEAISELAPVFPDAGDFADTMQEGLIQLVCPNPFWTDTHETKEEVAIWRGSLEFPLEIVADGIEIGYREPSLIVNILNRGDVPCGMKIVFKASATVEKPSLFHIGKQEEFKVKQTMQAGDVLTVTTHFQNKRVELNRNNKTTNAFNWIDLDGVFLQLEPGDNLLRYNAENGIENLNVDIYYSPQYLGV